MVDINALSDCPKLFGVQEFRRQHLLCEESVEDVDVGLEPRDAQPSLPTRVRQPIGWNLV